MERENDTPPSCNSTQFQTPLLPTTQNQNCLWHQAQPLGNDVDDYDDDTHLGRALQQLYFHLTLLGFRQTSILSIILSWLAFLVLGIAIPVTLLELNNCSGCEKYQLKEFEIDCLASQAALAAVSLLCLSHHLRKYGIRKFLFLDRHSGHMAQFMDQYTQRIRIFYGMLIRWLLPCLILKAAFDITRVFYAGNKSWWISSVIVLGLVISWIYMNTVSLAACLLFHLVCSLQVVHFEEYCKSLERETNVFHLIEEHVRLRYHLSKISHRFRIYLLLLFLVVTASRFVTLLQIFKSRGSITFLNGSDVAVTTAIQLVGITVCLHAAAKISHRAQNVGSVACKWHALLTSRSSVLAPRSGRINSMNNLEEASSYRPHRSRQSSSAGNLEILNRSILQCRHSSSTNNLEAFSDKPSHSDHSNRMSNTEIPNHVGHAMLHHSTSESDLESLDSFWTFTSTQLASLASSYHNRESFVTYLQTNPGGITIYGWKVDRTLIGTIFGLELSLVLFLLGNTLL